MSGFRALIALAAVLAAVLLPAAAGAQEFPDNKPIRWVLGFSAGGASDILARATAKAVEEKLGTQVVVENRPGASGIIAAGLVHGAAPDGHTILLVSSSYLNNVALGGKFDFDPLDFELVTRIAVIPNLVVVPADSPINSVQELIDAAKAKPGELNYASGGVGTGTHFGTELFKSMTGTDLVHVPFKGTQPALIDLIAGRVDVMFAGASPALPLIKAGKLKAIATTSLEPTAAAPELPTVAKTVPGYEAVTWYALFAPKGTPAPVVAKLNAAFTEALKSETLQAELLKQGFDAAPTSPEDLKTVLDTYLKQTADTAKKAGISLESIAN